MPWRAIILGTAAMVLVVGGIIALYLEYALPPCSLEAEPLLRQLDLCR